MKKFAFLPISLLLIAAASCGGNTASKDKDASAEATEQTKQAMPEQPLESGQYRAVSYDITGKNIRKGKFDGRVLLYVSPESSGFYVFENGNRAKIDYKVLLKAPFEKADSGRYTAVDLKDLPVTLTPDSVDWVLSFEKGENKVNITIESAPMNTGTPVEIMERIAAQIQKNKQ